MNKNSDGRVLCLNIGCNNFAQKDKLSEISYKIRPFCRSCQQAYRGLQNFNEGVYPIKSGICSNQSGHLGFYCGWDYEKAPWAIGDTEIDHIDGNDQNNELENVQELCSSCHMRKSKQNGDLNRYKVLNDGT